MNRRTLIPTLAALLLVGTVATIAAQEEDAAGPPGFKVVVHAENPLDEVERRTLERIFLKKIKTWEDGTSCQPVDREVDTALREAFSEEVVDKSVSAVKSYWQRMIFSGKDAPPPELASDEQVLAYVAERRGGVGYVSDDAELPTGVKTIDVVD